MRWIRDHYTQSFRVQDVAQLAGMSVSAFRRNFQPVTTMSPIQFQKQIRLQEARLLLARTKATSRASATASVTTALAVQPRVPPQVRRPAQPGRRTPVRSGTQRRPLAAVNADAL